MQKKKKRKNKKKTSVPPRRHKGTRRNLHCSKLKPRVISTTTSVGTGFEKLPKMDITLSEVDFISKSQLLTEYAVNYQKQDFPIDSVVKKLPPMKEIRV